MGKSAPLSEAWGVEEYAAHTARLLDSLRVRGAQLAAASSGGVVARMLLV